MCAAEDGHTETAKLLLKHGADVNAKNNSWTATAIKCATKKGHTETANLLRSYGAN